MTSNNFLFETVTSIFDVEDSSNTILNVNGKKINVIRKILSDKSPIFCAMFNSNFAEKGKLEILINDENVDSEIFKEFLFFLYTGQINIDTNNIIKLIYMADQYDVNALIEKCATTLKSLINIENIISVWNSIILIRSNLLNDICLNFFSDNMDAIIINETSISDMSEDVIFYITDNEYIKMSEINLFLFFHRWCLLTKPLNDVIATIMKNIRLPLIKTTDLIHLVKVTGIANKDSYIEAIEFNISPEIFDEEKKKQKIFNYRRYQNFELYLYYVNKTYPGYRMITNDDLTPLFVAKLNNHLIENQGLLALDDIHIQVDQYIRTDTNWLNMDMNGLIYCLANKYSKNKACSIYDRYNNNKYTKQIKITIGNKIINNRYDDGLAIYVKEHYTF